MDRGIFIAFEGIDGSGKSTQIHLLKERILKENISCYDTFEPSSGPIGVLARQFLSGRMKTDNRVLTALFAADRLDHILNETDGILKKIEDGITVLTDRYYFSSYAYHGLDVPMEDIIKMNEESASLLRPNLTIFIDVSAKKAMKRINKNRFHTELFEKESQLEKIRYNYLEAFDMLRDDENIIIIDGNGAPERIHEDIWKVVKPLLPQAEE